MQATFFYSLVGGNDRKMYPFNVSITESANIASFHYLCICLHNKLVQLGEGLSHQMNRSESRLSVTVSSLYSSAVLFLFGPVTDQHLQKMKIKGSFEVNTFFLLMSQVVALVLTAIYTHQHQVKSTLINFNCISNQNEIVSI